MNIVMAVAPFGNLGKAGGKIAKAFQKLRRSSRAFDIVGTTAEHLFKVLPYRQAAKLTAGRRHTIEAHHLLEVRHARRWGIDANEVPAVILTRKEHLRLTGQLRKRIPYGVIYDKKDKKKVWAVYKDVYSKYPEWLEAIEGYFR